MTAGATAEKIDPVRFITNHSTGKMGCAVAKRAMLRGADVTLVCGRMTVEPPPFVHVVRAESAAEMCAAVLEAAKTADIVVKAAAVADYRPKTVAAEKIKKHEGGMTIELERTTDILATLGAEKPAGQFLCGFSMETENLLENAAGKLKRKHLDMIVANSLRTQGAGFGVDTNVVTLLTENETEELPLLTKDETADRILTKIQSIRKGR